MTQQPSPQKEEKFIEKQYQKISKGLSDVIKDDGNEVIISNFHLRNLIRDALRIGFRRGNPQ